MIIYEKTKIYKSHTSILYSIYFADERYDFIAHITTGTREYRFQGSLGFGGKFYNDHKWRIGCYKEDDTPERTAVIEEINTALEQMRELSTQ